jgi:hypothetical protein
VAFVGMMRGAMPPERFAPVGWIRSGLTDEGWTALAAQVPGLA